MHNILLLRVNPAFSHEVKPTIKQQNYTQGRQQSSTSFPPVEFLVEQRRIWLQGEAYEVCRANVGEAELRPDFSNSARHWHHWQSAEDQNNFSLWFSASHKPKKKARRQRTKKPTIHEENNDIKPDLQTSAFLILCFVPCQELLVQVCHRSEQTRAPCRRVPRL